MNREVIANVAETFLAASLPIDPSMSEEAAKRVIELYENASSSSALPAEEVADRFSEIWNLWFASGGAPSKELRDVVGTAICVDPSMAKLAREYFRLEQRLEKKVFMSRSQAIELIGESLLIRTLAVDCHLGLDRILSAINSPRANFDAIGSVLKAIGVSASFCQDDVERIHKADVENVALYFGDTPADEAGDAFRELLGGFSRSDALWEDVNELVYIGFEPYLFMLYFELLTLETMDRFPGRAIYECGPRGAKVKALWNSMYHPTQENPYLNNAKSVYSLDLPWAETKLSPETQNSSLMLVDIFDIMAELPYALRRRVAHVVRCYLILVTVKNQVVTPLSGITPDGIRSFIDTVCSSNSLTKGVLDQRLVDFLTRCSHEYDEWAVLGLGASVNETNSSGRKYGDVEYLDLSNRVRIQAYEAHGGGLRDAYIEGHINSINGTVEYHKDMAKEHSEDYVREVEITYVAHDVSRISRYCDGYSVVVDGVPFELRFITFFDLLEESGGIDAVCGRTELFDELVHGRISRLPDAYSLKRRYREIVGC